jgi:hypothetical protein
MSLSLLEVESLTPHVPHMRGHVVIAGLGMGLALALYNALLRPAVRRVSAVERPVRRDPRRWMAFSQTSAG